jgi:acetoin utilization deacetylase AcuC-like enzyme
MGMPGILYDPIFEKHDPGQGHPESPERLEAVKKAIDALKIEWSPIKAVTAGCDELRLIHTQEYIDYISGLKVTGMMQLDIDTTISIHSKEAALKAAGGTAEAVRQVVNGRVERVFCAVRPPGHHAEADRAMGFCLFNNVAIGAAYALTQGLDRVAIVDWDLHHGNGTQHAFYDCDRVLYISLHQSPYYPGTGFESEKGRGQGLGYTINIPMVAGSSDADYREAFAEIVIPALRNFQPELLFISAGFDAHREDHMGGLSLTTEYFGEMTRNLREIAEQFCKGRVISVLEGGYNLRVLEQCTAIHLKELFQ